MDPRSNSRKGRAQRRTGCSRNRKLYGGGLGTSYGFGGSVDPANPSIGNAAEVVKFSSCGNAVPNGFLSDTGTKGGLPGFAGGGRRKRRRGTRRRRTMYGGVYTIVPNVVGDSKIALPEASYTGCGEGRFAQPNMSIQQPPSPGYPTAFLTAPPPLVPTPSPGAAFTLQKGGSPVGGNTYAADAMVYQAPRSGYTDLLDSSGPTAAGPPFSIHTPYSPQPQPSPACLKTGGGYRKTKKNRKASRKQKRRSSSRKYRNTRRK